MTCWCHIVADVAFLFPVYTFNTVVTVVLSVHFVDVHRFENLLLRVRVVPDSISLNPWGQIFYVNPLSRFHLILLAVIGSYTSQNSADPDSTHLWYAGQVMLHLLGIRNILA